MVPGCRAHLQVVFRAPEMASVSALQPPVSVDTLFLHATNVTFLFANRQLSMLSIFYCLIRLGFFFIYEICQWAKETGNGSVCSAPVLTWIDFSKIRVLYHLLGLFSRTVCALPKSYSIHCFF